MYTNITTNRIRNLYFETQYVLDERRIKKLAEVYFRTVKKEYISKTSIANTVFPGVNKRTGSIADFVSIFTNRYLEVYIQEIVDCFYEAVDEDEFSKASDLIEKLTNFAVDDLIKKMLIDNNFFLKDLEKDISEAKWSFMISIATIAEKQSLSSEYIAAIEKYHDGIKEDNNTLNVRILTLVRNNIDSNYSLKLKKR